MENQDYIFFLKLKPQLPLCYYHFANIFAQFNITLIPVGREELNSLKASERQYVMTVVDDLKSLAANLKLRKQFLDFALYNKRFSLFELSSFAPNPLAAKLQRIKVYHHFRLPLSIVRAAKEIVLNYYIDKKDRKLWPGGKRVRPPQLVMSN